MWLRCSAWPALQAATAPLVVALLLGSLFIGPQGVELYDLGVIAEAHSLFVVAILLLWSLAMAPAGHAALTAPGLRYLRWMPIPAWFAIGHLALVLFLLQAPIPTLLLIAGKPALALGLWGAGMGLSASLLLPGDSRVASLTKLGIGSAILGLLAFGHAMPGGALGVAGALLLLPRDYRRAAQPTRRPVRQALLGGPKLVLVTLQWLRLRRCESAALARALLLAALGALMVLLVNRANPNHQWSARTIASLVAATPSFALLATTLALALRRGQEELRWLRLSLGISTSRLRGASLLVLLAMCLGLALLLALVAVRSSPFAIVPGASLLALLAVHALFWASTASLLAYRAAGVGSDQSPAMWALCIALADMLLVGLAGPWSLVVEACLAFLIVMRILAADRNEELGHA
jgi:hypothetical protein